MMCECFMHDVRGLMRRGRGAHRGAGRIGEAAHRGGEGLGVGDW